MKKPKKPRGRTFAQLQKHWYDKLKKTGFKDIERGRDMNKIHASTLPGDHCTLDSQMTFDDKVQFQDHDRAERWRIVTHGLQTLSEFIQVYSDTGIISSAASAIGIDMESGRTVLSKLLTIVGLERYTPMRTRGSSVEELVPAPVKVLSQDEIRLLNLKPPKQIKENSEHVIPIHDTED